jgi:hypothetical protein
MRLAKIGFAAALMVASALGLAQAQEFSEPPADARVWVLRSTTSEHGREWRWRDADGAYRTRIASSLRGMNTNTEQRLVLDAAGLPVEMQLEGMTPRGPASESLSRTDGRAAWRSVADSGESANLGAYYLPLGGSLDAYAALTRALMADDDHTLDILPSGRARLERLAERRVTANGRTQTVVAWAIVGLSWTPRVVWFDEGNEIFATGDWLTTVQEGWESVVPELNAAQNEALAARAATLAAQTGTRPSAVLFQNVRIFDSERGRFQNGRSVLVENGRISAVGSARSVRAPAGAQVISGEGRTLLPGLWDAHMHISEDAYGPLLLANGITSVRDIGNDAAQLEERRRRIEAGTLLGPNIYASLLIDGPGPRAAQSAPLVTTADEAVALVRSAHERGYIGIKLYGSLNPALVAPIGAETERLGMRLSGHVPAGMRPSQAIADGYDELTHFYFTLMEGMPDHVVAESNGSMRFLGPAEFGAGLDYRNGVLADLLDTMAERGIASDPTFQIMDRMLLGVPGQLPAPYRDYEGALPAQMERGLRGGGFRLPEGVTREHAERSATNMLRMIPEMHRRGIVILAGTDGTGGIELVGELEAYVRAGLTPAQALQTATIAPARVVGRESETGSITVGKAADLFLVEGDPSRDLAHLRQVEWVMKGDRLIEAQPLREALGLGRARRH